MSEGREQAKVIHSSAGIAIASPRRKSRLRKLALKHADRRPHDIAFAAAIVCGIAVCQFSAVIVADALDELSQSGGFIEGKF
jgi:hypothetical protein